MATRVGISDGIRKQDDRTWSVSRIHHVLADGPVHAFRFVYANWLVDAASEDQDGPDGICVHASLESGRGDIWPMAFDGRREARLQPGQLAITDPISSAMAAGTIFCSRTAVRPFGASGFWPTNMSVSGGAPVDGFVSAATGPELADAGTMTDAGRTVRAFGPVAILGVGGTRATVAIIGDSIAVGAGDNAGDATKNVGFIERGLGNRVGFINVARNGATARAMAMNGHFRLSLVNVTSCTHAVINLGTNDLWDDTSTGEVMKALQAIWRQLRSQRPVELFQITILPRFSPGANEDVAAARDRRRQDLNRWLRSVPPPLTGIIDAAALVERNHIWTDRGNEPLTDDGTHPNARGASLLAVSVARIVETRGWAG